MNREVSTSAGGLLMESNAPQSESSSRSSKTSSSDYMDPKLASSICSDVPAPGYKPSRRSKHTSVSVVTADARKVLEQFLKLKYAQAAKGELSDESPYALLVQPPCIGQPVPPVPQKLCPCLPNTRLRGGLSQEEDDEGKNDFTDYEKIDDSPDYAEFGDDIDAPPGKGNSLSSQSSIGIGYRSVPVSRRQLNPEHTRDAHIHPPKVKSKAKGKAKRKALFDSPSSSSTEDYEYPDNELSCRKKKSFFKWASERLRQSFVRQGKKPSHPNVDELESPKAESLPASPNPRVLKKKKAKTNKLHLAALRHSSADKSKSNSGSPPNQEEGPTDSLLDKPAPPLTDLSLSTKDRRPSLADSTSLGESSSKRWKSPMLRKKQDGRPEKDNRGLFDSFLKQIRKGSQKLKRKGSKEHQRSKSADNLHIRPLTKEHEKVLRRYIADEAKDTESDTSTVHDLTRLDGASTLPPHIPRPQLPPPASPALGTGDTVHRSPPRPQVLGGLVSCAADVTPPPPCRLRDHTDGPPLPPLLADLGNSSKPFHLRTEREKEELYERIAEQLAVIADHYNLESPKSNKSSSSPTSHSAPHSESDTEKLGASAPRRGHRVRSAELERQLGALLREKGDMASTDMPDPTPVVAELVKNASYSKFKQIVNENIGTEPGWQQVAIMFRFTQTAVQLAGMGTAVALQIKEMTLKYFEDKFAGWIVGQGGWESMVEDTNTEMDSELD